MRKAEPGSLILLEYVSNSSYRCIFYARGAEKGINVLYVTIISRVLISIISIAFLLIILLTSFTDYCITFLT